MKASSIALLCCVIVIAAFAPARAVDKITVDPNTSAAQAETRKDEDFWTTDPRLASKVVFEARRRTVLAILADLSKTTGVTLHAGYNTRDWQVRDRKMVIFSRDMSLSDLMQSISRVMKFKWSRAKVDGAYVYRLSMDRKAVIEAEAEAARKEERYNKEQQLKREAFADELNDLSEVTGADLAKLREEDPMSYALAGSGMAGSLDRLFSELPGARDAFVSGNELTISRDEIPQQAQAAMIGIGQAISRINPDSNSMPTAEQLGGDTQRMKWIRLYPSESSSDAYDIMSRFTLGNVAMGYSNGPNQSDSEFGFPILDARSSLGRGLGEMLVGIMDSGSDEPGRSWSIKMDANEIERIDFGEPSVKHEEKMGIAEEMDFSKLKKSGSATEQYIDGLVEFSKTTKLNIVSDSFPMAMPISTAGTQPADALMGYLEFEHNWWKRGSTIELRDRHWFRKRSLEIPEAWLDKWRQTLKKTGTLEIDDLADIAALVGAKAQYAMNIDTDPVLNIESMKWTIQMYIPFLRLYAGFTAPQRSALYTAEGLDLSTLSADQKQAAKAAVPQWGGESGLRVMGTRKKADGKQSVYAFVATGGASVAHVTTPKYGPAPPDRTDQISPVGGGVSGTSHPSAK